MKFGNINPTRFGFGSSQDKDYFHLTKPCFCWLHSRLVISIREWSAEEIEIHKGGGGKGNNFTYHASHEMRVFCSTVVEPRERFQATFIAGNPGGPKNYLSMSWDIYKMCGGCDTQKKDNIGCKARKTLCRDSDDGGFTSNYKKLWKLRSELKQKEAEVKRIGKDIRKSLKKCKFDMACK